MVDYRIWRKIMSKLGCIIYHHRHGVDVLPFKQESNAEAPEITNDLLKKLGVDNPELEERDDEYAEYYYLYPIDHWPVIGE
jgi:hypothetical protein